MTDTRYAILDGDSKAVNFVVWDGTSALSLPQGHTIAAIPAGMSYGYGWTWDGSKFIDPNPAPPEEPAP